MSVKRKTAEAFRRHGPGGARKVAEYLRDHHNATRGTIWYEAAEALEQLAQPKAKVAAQAFAIRDLEAAERERVDNPPREDLLNMVRGLALRGITDYAGVWSWLLALEAIAARALDLAHDTWSSESWADLSPEGALADELHRAGFFDAETGAITPAWEALALRVARRGSAPEPAAAVPHRPDPSPAEAAEAEACDLLAASVAPQAATSPDHAAIGPCRGCAAPTGQPCRQRQRLTTGPAADFAGFDPGPSSPPAPRPLRVYVAGGSSEVGLVAEMIDTLRQASIEITHDWTADVIRWRAAGSRKLTAEQRAAHARADLDGIERADVVWWILPAALSEGSAFEAGYALGLAESVQFLASAPPRIVVSGDCARHGRVFPELAAERWSTHEAALAAIVSLAAERRKGGAT